MDNKFTLLRKAIDKSNNAARMCRSTATNILVTKEPEVGVICYVFGSVSCISDKSECKCCESVYEFDTFEDFETAYKELDGYEWGRTMYRHVDAAKDFDTVATNHKEHVEKKIVDMNCHHCFITHTCETGCEAVICRVACNVRKLLKLSVSDADAPEITIQHTLLSSSKLSSHLTPAHEDNIDAALVKSPESGSELNLAPNPKYGFDVALL
jgi:hypothetical protein